MRENEKLVRCPISKSSNRDEFNDLCKATGKPCPYYIDEGMSVCKSKTKCLKYFSKNLSGLNLGEVAKLIGSDTQGKSTKTGSHKRSSRAKHRTHTHEAEKAIQTPEEFMEGLEDALKKHQEEKAESASFVEGLEDALKNRGETSVEDVQEEKGTEDLVSALEKYKKN